MCAKKNGVWRAGVVTDLLLAKWLGTSWVDMQRMPASVIVVAMEMFREEQDALQQATQ